MITLTESMYRHLTDISRHALKQAPALTIRRDADPELFDYVVRTMPDAELFEQAAALLIGPAPAAEPEPEPKPTDPLIPRWIAEGEAAWRARTPRTSAPPGRKGPHWIAGWDREKAAHDADPVAAVSATFDAIDDGKILPPPRTPETDIDAEDAT